MLTDKGSFFPAILNRYGAHVYRFAAYDQLAIYKRSIRRPHH